MGTVAPGQRVTLKVIEMDLHSTSNYLKFYDGPTMDYPFIGSFSASNKPEIITSSSNSLFVKFYGCYSYSSGYGGFIAEYISEGSFSEFCSHSEDIILDHPFGDFGCGGYGNDISVSWTLYASDYNSVQLEFDSFNTEQGFDFVYVYDGADSHASLLGVYSGTAIPRNLLSAGNVMFVLFTSDSSTNGSGFS